MKRTIKTILVGVGIVCACLLFLPSLARAQFTQTLGIDAGWDTSKGGGGNSLSAGELDDLRDLDVNEDTIPDSGPSDWISVSFSNAIHTGFIVKSVIVYYNYGEDGAFGANNANLAVGTGWQAGGAGTTWTNKSETPPNDNTIPYQDRTWDVTGAVTNETRVNSLQFKITNNDSSAKILYEHVHVEIEYDFPPNYGPGGIVGARGPNPTNGTYWAGGDKYQLVFVTSTTTNLADDQDINFWNDYVNDLAASCTNVGVSNVTWYILASTHDVAAKTNALVSAPVYLMNGASMVVSNYTDMWDGSIDTRITIDEDGVTGYSGNLWTGSDSDGTKADYNDRGPLDAYDWKTANVQAGAITGSGNWFANRWYNETENRRFYVLSQPMCITNGAADTTKPFPDPMTWAVVPEAYTTNTVRMKATYAYDLHSPPVEYLFTNTVLGTTTGWQRSRTWIETVPMYEINTYQVKCRDAAGNETGWSPACSSTPLLLGPGGVAAPVGAHPTGGLWTAGHTYHLAFITSTKANLIDGRHEIEHWNDHVNAVADTSPLDGISNLNWFVLGSTIDVDAKSNAVVNAPVYLLDAETMVASNFNDMWDGSHDNDIKMDEKGEDQGYSGWRSVWTGSNNDGTKSSGNELDSLNDTSSCGDPNGGWMNNGQETETSYNWFYALSQEILIGTNGMVDLDPPTPTNMFFTLEPDGLETNSIYMQAAAASDLLSPPVSYLFTNLTTGGSSGWQTDRWWTNTVAPLSSNSYKVMARDAVSNETEWSTACVAYPLFTGPNNLPAPTGINPVTGENWKPGDSYHLVFLSSTTTNVAADEEITFWNDYVKQLADDSSVPGMAELNWYVIGSTMTVDAKDNAVVSAPVYLMDGESLVATNAAQMWNNTHTADITIDENAFPRSGGWRSVWTGSNSDGTKSANNELNGNDLVSTTTTAGDPTGNWMANGTEAETSANRFYALSQEIIIESDAPDTNAPTPNPMTWATEPTAASFDTISMRATSATDPESPPVEYLFTNTVTGESSGWQTDPDYVATVSRGSINTFRVLCRDSADPANVTTASAPVSCTPYLQGDNEVYAPTGVHPTNSGALWQIGDTYHLAFITSNKFTAGGNNNIGYFNTLVQGEANDSDLTDGVSWYVIGSTTATDARSNAVVTAPVVLTDNTLVASNYNDMWDGGHDNDIMVDQYGQRANYSGWRSVWTGSNNDGFKSSGNELNCADNTASAGDPNGNWMNNGQEDRTVALNWFYALSEELTIQIPPDSSSITNLVETDLAHTSVTFNAQLRTPLTNQTVYVHWGESNEGESFTWDSSAEVGSWDQVMLTNISFSTNGLTSGTHYYYTFRCTNATTNIWASPSMDFYTPASYVEVTNDGGATAVGIGTATLRGQIVTGGAATVYFCWGDNDGGTSGTGNWDNVEAGVWLEQDVALSNTLDTVYWGKTYYYAVYATNLVGEDWSTVDSFEPLIPDSAQIPPAGMNVICSGHYKGHDNAFDGSGMTGDTHNDDSDDMWMTDGTTISEQWIKVDLGATYTLDYMRVWNYNESFYNNYDRGVNQYDLFVATTDPATNFEGVNVFKTTGWTSLLVNQVFAQADGNVALENTDASIGLSDTDARYVAIRVDSNHGDGLYVGLSEVQFYFTDPGGAFTIVNTDADNVTVNTADLGGVLDGEDAFFHVRVYWSTNDNLSSAAWLADGAASSSSGGTYSDADDEVLSIPVASLMISNTYYYTYMISNAYTNVWASPNATFSTTGAVSSVEGSGFLIW